MSNINKEDKIELSIAEDKLGEARRTREYLVSLGRSVGGLDAAIEWIEKEKVTPLRERCGIIDK